MSDTQLNDLDFIKFYLNKANYQDYISQLDRSLLAREPLQIINALKTFYAQHPDYEQVDCATLEHWFLQFYCNEETAKEKQIYQELFNLMALRPDTPNEIILKGMRIKAFTQKLSALLEKELDFNELKKLTEEIEHVQTIVNPIEDVQVTENLDHLFQDAANNKGYSWGLKCLDDNIDPMPDTGFFLCVAGRPGTCKTSFVLKLATEIAKQLKQDEVVLWFNNENMAKRIKQRAASCVLNRSADSLKEAARRGYKIQDYYTKALGGKDNILFFDVHGQSCSFLERIIKSYKGRVRLIVMDMLDHVEIPGFKGERDAAFYRALYQWALGVSCQYASVIGTSQVSIIKGDPRYPTMEDLEGSKTAKQAAVSCQLMIGRDKHSNLRYLATPKNKYGKGGTVWNAQVDFEELTCQFKEV